LALPLSAPTGVMGGGMLACVSWRALLLELSSSLAFVCCRRPRQWDHGPPHTEWSNLAVWLLEFGAGSSGLLARTK